MNEPVRPVTFTLAALGGQGGGVVADWLIEAARRAGYIAQATSVPGVAQRTGATIYYLEFFPRTALPADGREPVMGLMPHPGDVDVVVAAELMEAGRAVQRGIVTPDRTVLVTSTHRVYAIGEKIVPGDGRADAARVAELAASQARRFVALDMAQIAEETGAVISAVILGAVAGSGALPFSVQACREAVRASGLAVEANLRAFDAAAAHASEAAQLSPAAQLARVTQRRTGPPGPRDAGPATSGVRMLLARVDADFPEIARQSLRAGVMRLIDYQDVPYAELYLCRVEEACAAVRGAEPYGMLTETVARGLALWMSFEDTIRVADLKIRAERLRRVEREVRATPDQVVHVTEFMKPRVEELCGTLPAALGRRLLRSPWWRRRLEQLTRDREVRTTTISGFLQLCMVAALRRMRRATLRFHEEDSRIVSWLELIGRTAARDPQLAVEIAACQRLVKGYGETFERGLGRFEQVMTKAAMLAGRADAAAVVRELREAALRDETGAAFGEALRRVA